MLSLSSLMEAISPAKAWIVLARLSSLESLIHDVPVSVTGFPPTPCFRSDCTSSSRARLEGESRDLRSAMAISSWYPIRARSRFWSRDILSFSKDKGRRVKLLRGGGGSRKAVPRSTKNVNHPLRFKLFFFFLNYYGCVLQTSN